MNVDQKIMAKYMNNSKNYEAYFEFFCWANIQIFLLPPWSWKNNGQIYKYIKIY